jgi:hypothetical protein
VVVGITPFIVLSVVPIIIGLCFSVAPFWLVALSTVNAFGASGDLIGAGLLALQVPASGRVRNKGRDTWWRCPAGATRRPDASGASLTRPREPMGT